MSTPEPVDEQSLANIEVRGGDRDEDFMPEQPEIPPYAKGGLITADPGEHGDWVVPGFFKNGH